MADTAPEVTPEVPAQKSAAEILVEMQLAKEIKAQRNPLAVVESRKPKGQKNEEGVKIASEIVFENGSVVQNYA